MKAQKTLIGTLAAVTMLTFVSPILAQYHPTGADGITASPKLREGLEKRHRSEAAIAAPESLKMPCPKCTDTVTSRVDSLARGANKPLVRAASHNCKACGTGWRILGTGKAKKSVATHTCKSCGAVTLACCNSANDSIATATNGMEK